LTDLLVEVEFVDQQGPALAVAFNRKRIADLQRDLLLSSFLVVCLLACLLDFVGLDFIPRTNCRKSPD
jgi:hypothetical protein